MLTGCAGANVALVTVPSCGQLKEMLENSLDAGATSIMVLAKGGGLKLLQIQDTGHGILRDDFVRVCERFATSKLREYEDLEKIETFGFRGEALASISHVAHVTITSMTDGTPCAYRACFADGHLVPAKPGETAEPKPCAGTRGTTIVVEDMFYNVPARRSAMKSVGEEYGKLLQVVQAYAIDNAGVAISCRKGTEGGAELHTLRDQSTTDVVRQVYGASLARELLAVEGAEPSVGLTVRGLVSNANHSAKKITFLLFINKRLVESSSLRRAVEEAYAACLPRGGHPFVYLSLRLPPSALDVNVHPTKREVFFLEQEAVVAAVQTMLRERLAGANGARTFLAQAVLPGAVAGANAGTSRADGTVGASGGVEAATAAAAGAAGKQLATAKASGKATAAPDPRKLVRTNTTMAAGELDKYVCRPSDAASNSSHPGRKPVALTGSQESTLDGTDDGSYNGSRGGSRSGGECGTSVDTDAGGVVSGKRRRDASDDAPDALSACDGVPTMLALQPHACAAKRQVRPAAQQRPWVSCELTSIHALLRRVTAHLSRGLQAVFSQHTFVGVVDRRYVLLQHLTKLYVVHLGVASESFFYQQTLRRWGNLATIRLSAPVSVADLYLLGVALACNGAEGTAEADEADGGDEDGDDASEGVSGHDGGRGDAIPTMPRVRFDAAPSRAARRAAAQAAALLDSKAEMLLEYLSVEIFDGQLCALPQLVDGYVPPLNGLPAFVRRLVHNVDWTTEQPCFDGLAKQLATLYRVDEVGDSAAPAPLTDGATVVDDADTTDRPTEEACSAAWTIQHVLLPAMRRAYEPPTVHATNGVVVQVACTEQLYKIFERC